MNTPLRMLSLCSGIGGADLAAEATGAINIVGQVEIDPFCQAVLAKHWPLVKRMADIREVQGDEFGPVDIVAGGIPCQPFSNAGKRAGTADDRYLWPAMLSIVTKCQPAWVIVENVANFTTLALDIVYTDLEAQGYTSQAFVRPACAVNAPHERQRCFIVAYAARIRSGARGATSTKQFREANPEHPHPLSDAHSQGLQVRDRCPGRTWARTTTDGYSSGQDQRPMGGKFHGISSRLDLHRWPALPGGEQEEWEAPRTVTSKEPYRNQRLKALGNAIVPQQIYPIFQCIVTVECGEVAS